MDFISLLLSELLKPNTDSNDSEVLIQCSLTAKVLKYSIFKKKSLAWILDKFESGLVLLWKVT